jgi:hypothetical protein
VLGIVDPRTMCDSVDTELMALWLAHFSLKREAAGVDSPPPSSVQNSTQARIIDYESVDQQVNVCERLLL